MELIRRPIERQIMSLTGNLEEPAEDASTQGLIKYFRGRHRG